jgi:large subunit ribosomal protein L6
LQGSTHSIIKQIILGLSIGFRKQLNIIGVGYRAAIENETNILSLKLGYSHQIFIKIPKYLKLICIKPTKISIFGNNKQKVNQMAAIIRSYKLPEPYKGKGILYQNEKINKKEGKRS